MGKVGEGRRQLLPLLLSLLAFAIVAVFLTADSSSLFAWEPAAARSQKLIFLLAGQSNMAGRGGVSADRWDRVVPPECHPHPSVLRLTARRRWELAREPLHADVDVHKTCGVGPGLVFANAVRASCSSSSAAAAAVIGLVPCAVGGTRIERWARGAPLYEAMVGRARAALAKGGGRVEALLWYQGESDTVLREDAEAYGPKLERLIRDVRADLGLPRLLVIQVAIASGEGNFTDIVREAQKRSELPNVKIVDAMGLALQHDRLHLTTGAQVRLGSMLAQTFNSSTASTCSY